MPSSLRSRILGTVIFVAAVVGSALGVRVLFSPGPCDVRNPNINNAIYLETPRSTGSYEPGDAVISASGSCSGVSFCTGSIVADDPRTGARYLITAAHCVTDGDGVSAEAFHLDGELLGQPEPRADLTIDVVRIRLQDQHTATETLAIGDDLVAIDRYLTTSQSDVGLVVCHSGLSTLSYVDVDFTVDATATAPTCGPIESSDPAVAQLCFKALATFGDSGATVFHIDPNGDVAVAGVLNNTTYETTWFTGRIRPDRDSLACYTPIDQALAITGLTVASP